MTAVDTVVAELRQQRSTQYTENIRATVNDLVAALLELQAGLPPGGTEAANTFLAGPVSGAPAAPAYRVLDSLDFASTLALSIASLIASGNVTGAAIIPTGATVPANGMYLSAANTLNFSTNTTNRVSISSTGNTTFAGNIIGSTSSITSLNAVQSANANAYQLINSAASATQPTVVFNRADLTTGRGAQAVGNMSEIVAGIEIVRYVSTGLQMQGTTGIKFGTGAVLNDYETGTWTPTDNSGAGLVFAGGTVAGYTRTGNMVDAYFDIIYPATVDASNASVAGLPFATANSNYARQGNITITTSATTRAVLPVANTATFAWATLAAGVVTNAQMTGTTTFGQINYPIT